MIDSAILTMVQSAYGALAGNVKTIFRTMLLFYVVWWGYLVLMGKTTVMPLEIAERIAKVIFIYAIATEWSYFSVLVYNVVMQTPDAIGTAIMSASGSSPGTSGIVTALNKVYDQGVQLVGRVYVGSYFDILGAILAGIILLGMLGFIGAVMGILIACKLLMAGVLCLAPIFIILAMFGYTFRFLDGYIRALANLMVSMILVYAFLGVYAGLLDKAIAGIGTGTDLVAKIGIIAPFLFVCVCGLLVVYQIPSIAAAITGGASDIVRTGLSAMSMSGRAGGLAAAGAAGLAGAGLQRLRGIDFGRAGGAVGGPGAGAAAMQENLKRIGRPPILEGEILPPPTRPGLTFQRRLPPPPRALPPPG
jgi:type IV secretion system protein VirB6